MSGARISSIIFTICACVPCFVYGQTTEAEVRESIWQLDNSRFLPSRYALAIEGTRECLYPSRGVASLRFRSVTFRDTSNKVRVDAYYSDRIDKETFEPRAGTWQAISINESKKAYALRPYQVHTFDTSKRLEKHERDIMRTYDKLVFTLDPTVFPIAPPSFADVHGNSTDMVFVIYEGGKLEDIESTGNKIRTVWKVGPKRMGRVTIEFEKQIDGTRLPVYAKWEAPRKHPGEDEDKFWTSYVVKTTWQQLEWSDEKEKIWVPSTITCSRRIGYSDTSVARDTSYNFHWSPKIPMDLESEWSQLQWERQIEQIKESTTKN